MLKPFPLVKFRCEHFFYHVLLIGVDLFMNIVFLQDFILFNMIWVQCSVTFVMLNLRGRVVDQHNVGKIHRALEQAFWYLTHEELEDFRTKFKANG
jgi:hypothetical protein